MDAMFTVRRVAICLAFALAPAVALAAKASAVSPLHAAALQGDLEALKQALATAPTNMDCEDATGRTPLMLAAQEGHLDAVQWLLAQGASANHTNRDGGNPLLSAVSSPAVFDRPANGLSEDLLAGLYAAAQRNSLAPVATPDQAVVPAGSVASIHPEQSRLFQPLPPDLLQRKVRIVEQLLAAGASAKPTAAKAWTVLHSAAQIGGEELLAPLLRAGADPNLGEASSLNTPLHCAVVAGNASAVAFLLAHGADAEALSNSQVFSQQGMNPAMGGSTALMLAILLGRGESVRLLLVGGAKIETANRTFDRAVHFAAGGGDHTILKQLLDRGARVTVRDRWHAAPLHYAAIKGHLEAVKLLLDHGTNLETADEAGYTPLLDAIEHNRLEVVKFLLKQGASLGARTNTGKGPLRVATTPKNLEMARFLIEECGEKAAGEARESHRPIHEAIGSGSSKLTALFLDHGADPGVADSSGLTPLHYAIINRILIAPQWRRDRGLPVSLSLEATSGAVISATDAEFDEIIRLLAAHGAKLNAPDKQGDTPLHLAAKYGAHTAVALLLELGASRETANSSGRTPLDLAVAQGRIEIVKLLGGPEDLIARRVGPSMRERLSEKLKSRVRPVPAAAAPPVASLAHSFLVSGNRKMATDPDGALRDLNRAIELDPALVKAYSDRGLMRLSKGDMAGALADLDRGIALGPTAELFGRRGLVKGFSRDFYGAIADYNRAIELDPKVAENYLQRGKAHLGKSNRDDALADFGRALAIDPRFVPAYEARAATRAEQGDHDGVIADCTRLIELKPSDAAPLVWRGEQYRAKHEHDRAIADYTAAIKLAPTNADAFLGRGYAHDSKSDYRASFADFDRAIQLNPKSAKAFNGRGYARKACGDFDAALVDFNRAIELNPRFAASYHNRAITRQALGDYPAAIADYDKYLAQIPAVTYQHLYRFLCLPLPQRDAARPALVTTIARWSDGWPKSLGRYLVGEITAGALLDLAAQTTGRAANLRLCEAHYAIGMTELAAGRKDGARSHFEKSTTDKFPAFSSFQLAQAELERLRNSAPKP